MPIRLHSPGGYLRKVRRPSHLRGAQGDSPVADQPEQGSGQSMDPALPEPCGPLPEERVLPRACLRELGAGKELWRECAAQDETIPGMKVRDGAGVEDPAGWAAAIPEHDSGDGGRVWIAGNAQPDRLELEIASARAESSLRAFLQDVCSASGAACLPGRKLASTLLRSLGRTKDQPGGRRPPRDAVKRQGAELSRLLKELVGHADAGRIQKRTAERLLEVLSRELPEAGAGMPLARMLECAMAGAGREASPARALPEAVTAARAPRNFNLELEAEAEPGPGPAPSMRDVASKREKELGISTFLSAKGK